MTHRLAGALVGFAALITGAIGTQFALASVGGDDAFPVVGVVGGGIVVGAALLGLAGGFVLFKQPSTERFVGLLVTDRVAAALIALFALVAGYFGIDGLFACSTGGDLCFLGVMAGGLFIVIALVGLGLSVAIWKQPTIGRLLGLLGTGIVAGFVIGSTVSSVVYSPNHRLDSVQLTLSSVLGASLIFLTASTVRWLRSKPAVD